MKTIRQQAIDYEREKGAPLTLEELAKFEEGWAAMMVDIWKEKIERLKAIRTGALYRSFGYTITGTVGSTRTIAHRFLEYGIYVERGTGREITKGNGGDLGFTPNRKRKPWFSKRYYGSIMKLNEHEAKLMGEAYRGMMTDALNILFGGDKIRVNRMQL
jgi:hypothetical protein